MKTPIDVREKYRSGKTVCAYYAGLEAAFRGLPPNPYGGDRTKDAYMDGYRSVKIEKEGKPNG